MCGVFVCLFGRDSIATGYGLDGPGIEFRLMARFSARVQIDPGPHPASCTIGTTSFLGAQRPERVVEHPPSPSGEVEERVEVHLCSPSGHLWPLLE